MIVFHKKGEQSGRTGQLIGEYIALYWEADGFHDTDTRKPVEPPANAKQLKAEWKAKRDAAAAVEQAEYDARRAKQDAYFALSPCERFVKTAMLRFPSIFPTRIKVLDHAFLTIGNGIYWNNGGDTRDLDGPGAGLYSSSSDYERDEVRPEPYEFPAMRYNDLIDREADYRRAYAHVFNDPESTPERIAGVEESIARILEMTKDETARELAERQAVEQNIDALIKPDPNAIIRGHYGCPSGILSYGKPLSGGGTIGMSKLFQMPRSVHPSFFAAALEVIDASIRGATPGDAAVAPLLETRQNIIDAFTKGRSEQAKRLKAVVTPPPVPPTVAAPNEKDDIDAFIDSLDDGTVLSDENKARCDELVALANEVLAEVAAEDDKPVLAPGRKSNLQAQPRISDDHPVFVDETTGKRIQYREIGAPYHTINILVNGQAVKACRDYSEVLAYVKGTLGITHESDLEVLYREYKHDFDERFP